MASITKSFTFSSGAVIVAAEHNSNFDVIFNDYNGNIGDANFPSDAISDSKLKTITTAGAVNLSSLVIASQTAGDIIYASSSTAFTRLAAGSSGQLLQSAGTTAPAWATAGKVLQVINTTDATSAAGSLRYVLDNNAPTGTFKGNQFMTLVFTPTITSGNRLRIECQAQLEVDGAAHVVSSVHNGTAVGDASIATAFEDDSVNGQNYNMMLVHFITSSTTAATTFAFNAGADAGTTIFNGIGDAAAFGGTMASSMTITEYSS